MSKILLSDLEKLNKSSCLSELTTINTLLNKIVTNLDFFREDSKGKLNGPVYDFLMEKIQNLSNEIRSLSNYAPEVEAAMKNSNRIMISYMEDYAELDTSNIEEIKNNILHYKELISSLHYRLNIISQSLDRTKNPGYMFEIRDQIRRDLAVANSNYREFNKILDKLERLDSQDFSANNDIMSVRASLETIGSKGYTNI